MFPALTDSVLTTSTPHLYPVPTSDISNYNNFILSVYSRDSTGVDCYSDYDTTEISFHSNPAIPALTLNVGGSTVIANQTIEICPTSDDSLVDTNVGGGNSIFTVATNAPQTTDILQLQSSGDFSPLTTELVSYHTSEIQTLALVPTTCYSDTDTVFIQTYAIPVDPELTSDTSYCEGESLSILDVQNDALVHNLRWSNNVSSATDSVLTTSTPHLYPVPTSDISNYNNFILSVYSRDSTGVDCYSDYDTTEISFHSNPAIPALTLNVGGSTVIANQTIEICPTSDDSLVDTNVGGGNSIFTVATNAPQTTDILQLQSSGDFSPLTTELVSYHTSEIQTLALVPTTCYSDTDTVFIQTYAIPVDPELTSDTSYCEGESLSILDVQNDALVHNLRWSNNVSSATDSVLTTSTPHLYPVPTSDISNYNNFILSVYSRDSTGVDCYSDYDTTEISFHSNPAIPALTLNVGGSTVIANQTIEICPTSDDSLVDTNVGGGNSIFAVSGNAPQTTDILQLQSSGDFSPLTTELVSYHTSEIQTLALVPTTCYSDTDTVFIQTYAIPVDPELTSDTSYCEGESLSILDVQNDALVHNLRWSNNVSSATDSVLTTSTPHLYPVPTSDISNYNNFTLSVYSRDSTGVDCYSDYDTTEISFHSNPAIPALTLNVGGSTVIANQTIEICPTSDDSLVDTNVGGGNSIFTVATNAPQTTDILQLQSSGDFSPLTTELVSYHTSEIQTLALVPTTCYSDTDTVFIQTYAIPVDPQLTSDTSYCEGESLSILDVQNDALVHNLRWSNNVSSATDSVLTTSTPHLYPVPTSDISNYNNFTLSVYSRDSTGVDCYSDYDTTEISFHSNPAIPALTLNVGGSTVIANQTIEICPTSDDSLVDTNVGGGNSIFAVSGNAPQTTDILQLQSSGDFSPLTTELVSYHTSEIQTLALVPTTCYSDTDTVFIQTYAIPVDPELTSDTSYCEGESLSILDVQNDALVHNLRWSNNVSSATDSVLTTSTPHLYPVPTIDISNYNNFTLSVYSRDSTGVDCYSDYDTTEISFHSNPAIPALTLNGTGPNLVNGSTYNICPTLPLEDSIVATVLSGSSVFIVNNIENVTSIVNIEAPDFVPGSLELVSYFTSEDITGSLVPITCRSNIDSIYINTLGLPIEPIILTDGVDLDEISFCSGDNINNVLTLNDNTNPVYWEQLGVIGSQNPDSIAYVFTIPGSFAPQTRIYIAYDTTGVDYAMNICASDADTVWISYGEREATPDVYSVNLADTSYCPESNLVDILTDNGFGFPVISDWFLGDTLGVPINVNTSQITPSWDFSADTILTYYAQKPAVGIGCPSYFGSIDIHFHTTPEIPAINFNGAENGYCPGTFVGLDTLTSDSLIYWYYTDPPSTVVANDSFDLNGINTTMGQSKELNYFFIDEHTCISDTAQFSIDFHNFAIEPFILSDTTYCLGDIDADSLRARNSLAAPLDSLFGTGSWYASNGVPISSGVSSNTFNLGVSPPQIVGDTSFLFNYIDTNGCVSVTDTITLTTFPIPGAPSILVTDSVFCDGEDITPLNEINGEPANWYLIVNNSPDLQLADNSTYTPADSGTYIATVIVNECESEADTVEIVIKPIPDAPIIADMQLQYCNDQIVDTINIQSSFKGTWYNGNDIVTAVATDTNSYLHTTPIVDSVVYLVNVLDPSTECYSDFDTVTLYQFVTVASISTELAEICLGFAQDLEAIGGVSYAWSTLDSVASISVAPNESTWYFVDIVDENDCKIRDSIEVILKLPSSCESQVYTAFSPNGDGVNETWEITGIELYENPVVYIFNRWGDKIATIKNYDNELNVWDGTNQLNGKAVVYGTYYYIIEDGTTKVKDGWLQVVK